MKYSGIGSRSCPPNQCDKLSSIARILAARQHILRSGGAEGADKAFENGHLTINKNMEIYIPWRSFAKPLMTFHIYDIPKEIEKQAGEMAEKIHPAWNKCSDGAKRLHTRNIYQVLGKDLKSPSSFLIAWTPDGRATGGSRTAIILADMYDVPVFNTQDDALIDKSAMEIVRHISKNVVGL